MSDPTPPSEADYEEATQLYDEACGSPRTEAIELIGRALAARTERARVSEACRSAVDEAMSNALRSYRGVVARLFPPAKPDGPVEALAAFAAMPKCGSCGCVMFPGGCSAEKCLHPQPKAPAEPRDDCKGGGR